IKYRTLVEVHYFMHLLSLEIPALMDFPSDKCDLIKGIAENFSLQDAEKVKAIESKTNHDVKAIEYFIRDKFREFGLERYGEFIHFGLTSQDINNTSVPLS